MNEENRKMLEESELNYRGHLDYVKDTVSDIEKIVSGYGEADSVAFERELVQLVINAR